MCAKNLLYLGGVVCNRHVPLPDVVDLLLELQFTCSGTRHEKSSSDSPKLFLMFLHI